MAGIFSGAVLAAEAHAEAPALDDFLGVGGLVELEADHQVARAGAGLEDGARRRVRLRVVQQRWNVAEGDGFTAQFAAGLPFFDRDVFQFSQKREEVDESQEVFSRGIAGLAAGGKSTPTTAKLRLNLQA